MLSNNRIGLVVVALMPWHMRWSILPSISYWDAPSGSFITPLESFNPISSKVRVGASFTDGHFSSYSFSRSVSFASFRRPGVGQQQRKQNTRKLHAVKRSFAAPCRVSNCFKTVTSLYASSAALSPALDQSSDNYKKDEPQEPDFSLDIKKNITSSRMPRKWKANPDLVSSTKQQQSPSSKETSCVAQDWCCYLLLSVDSKKTYVGVTFDTKRRLRQHNGELSGGAKAARAGRPWRLVCTVQGFNSRSEACQFEWRWKSASAKIKTIVQQDSETTESPLLTRRRATLAKALEWKEEWSFLNIQWLSE